MARAFVVAMECEADAVRGALRGDDRIYVSGIGKTNAAAATMRAICEGATEIVSAGLCGGFDPSMRIGDVYSVGCAVEYDYDLAQLNGTEVGQKDERDSPFIPAVPDDRLPVRRLATGDRFSDSEADVSLLARLGLTLRDMEGAAIADVCDKARVPCRLYKCVSDVHGRESMVGQFLENRQRCIKCLTDALISLT